MTKMTLQVLSDTLTANELAQWTRQMETDIRRHTSCDAKHLSHPPTDGSKGDLGLMGQLVLTFLSGGTAVALVDLFRAYLDTDPTVEFELTRSDGTSYRFKATDMATDRMNRTFEAFRAFVESTK